MLCFVVSSFFQGGRCTAERGVGVEVFICRYKRLDANDGGYGLYARRE